MHHLAAHEMLEAHELISAKSLGLEKSNTYLEQAKDPELRDLIKKGIIEGKQMLQELNKACGGE